MEDGDEGVPQVAVPQDAVADNAVEEDAVPDVVVDGWGPVAEELVAQLRRYGLVVGGGLHAADGAELRLDGRPPPRVVVVVAQGRTPAWAGDPWHARGVPHLPVVLGRHGLVVGPLVLPGRTACLRCTGPAWDGSRVGGPSDVPAGTLVLATAVAVVTVLTTLRGDDSLGGISTEVALDEVRVTHRVWGPRPGCRCARVRMAG
ncbi:hypothetical protein [Oryzobacter terrae]|uniref:hypothetical protein n=1 Tax=Oryzobacter terrae TaxID=1620385 RepID=UPI00366FD422